jgi:hypothetical protein
MRSALALLSVSLSVVAMARPSPTSAGAGEAAPAIASPVTITFSFKLDPRVLGPTYGGERWVSPRTFTGATAQDTVEARAQAVDARGRRLAVVPAWTPSDPEMMTVSPARGEQVRITVKRPGESSLVVTAGGASGKLTVKAVEASGSLRVDISQ